MSRRTLLHPAVRFVLACVASLLALGGIETRAQSPRPNLVRPNLVMIVADDLGYADLGSFGGLDIKTPHLDELAQRGVRATNFYVTWPACTPSRASILTGRYPQRNGLYDMIRNDLVNYGHRYTEEEYAVSPEMTLGMDLREIVIAQVLQEAGYATGVIGKWDGGRARRFLPLQRGFDFFYGFANTGIDYWTHERYGVPSLYRGNDRIQEEGYATELFRREALAFVDRHREQPFFLYLPFNAPHSASNLEKDSYQAPEAYLAQYPDQDPTANRTEYRAMVTCLDAAVGSILQRLRDHGLEQNTLVLFFSDNGGTKIGSNGPLRGYKSQMYEGGLRVPFIAAWPGKLPERAECHEFLSALELFPMLCAAAGTSLPQGVIYDGFDPTAVLRGEQASPRGEMFWQRRGEKAARVGNHKLVVNAQGTQLFDLANDVGEKHNLSAERPEILAQIQARWADWRAQMDRAEPRGPFRDY